jgi:uncharacterized protein YegP (UPF0339 family)
LVEKLTSLVSKGSTGSVSVLALTIGYLWLQTMGEGASNDYTMLLALSFLLYYLGSKDESLQQPAEPPEQRVPPSTVGCHEHPRDSHSPNITITVNGEKSQTCEVPSEGYNNTEPESNAGETPELCFYRIYKDKADQYRWQLKTKALNEEGEVIAEIIGTSHQGFKTPIKCLNEIYRVMECCNARIEEDIDGDGKSTVVVPRPPQPTDGRTTPYVDRTNVLRQELLTQKLFRDINKLRGD